MSRAAEEAHERWFEAHLKECVRDLVVGVKVYRVGYDKVEEGEMMRISRARRQNWNNLVEDPNGPHIVYYAHFSDGAYGWEMQTWQYIFFFRREDAQKKLAQQLRERAKDLRRDADKWEALATTLDEATS